MVIALSGGELIFFELSAAGQLLEMTKSDMPGDVAALDLLPVPEGRQRARFLAVGAYDNTARPGLAARRGRLQRAGRLWSHLRSGVVGAHGVVAPPGPAGREVVRLKYALEQGGRGGAGSGDVQHVCRSAAGRARGASAGERVNRGSSSRASDQVPWLYTARGPDAPAEPSSVDAADGGCSRGGRDSRAAATGRTRLRSSPAPPPFAFLSPCARRAGARAAQVRMLSLDPEDALKVAAVQAVDATPESLLMLDSPVAEAGADGATAGAAALFLHTGASAQRARAQGPPCCGGALARAWPDACARFGRAAVAREGRARRALVAAARPAARAWAGVSTCIRRGRVAACELLSPLQTCPPG